MFCMREQPEFWCAVTVYSAGCISAQVRAEVRHLEPVKKVQAHPCSFLSSVLPDAH